jgi:hypothetical protein
VLGGSGSISGLTVSTGGTVTPGNSPGTLTVNGTTAGTGHDQLGVNGNIGLSDSNLTLTLSYAPIPTDYFYILNNNDTDAITGTFLGLAQGATVLADFGGTSYTGTISYIGNSGTSSFIGAGNDAVVYNFTAVPEPGTLALCVLGIIPLLRRRRH